MHLNETAVVYMISCSSGGLTFWLQLPRLQEQPREHKHCYYPSTGAPARFRLFRFQRLRSLGWGVCAGVWHLGSNGWGAGSPLSILFTPKLPLIGL